MRSKGKKGKKRRDKRGGKKGREERGEVRGGDSMWKYYVHRRDRVGGSVKPNTLGLVSNLNHSLGGHRTCSTSRHIIPSSHSRSSPVDL